MAEPYQVMRDFPGEKDELILALNSTFPDLIFLFDIYTGKTVYVSRNLREHLGYPAGEDKHISVDQLDHFILPGDLGELIDHGYQFIRMKEGEKKTLNLRMKTATGAVRSYTTTFTPYRSEKSKLIFGVAQDITDKKQTEEEHRRIAQLYRSLIESQTSFLIRTQIDGNISFTNRRFASMLKEGQNNFYQVLAEDDHELCALKIRECAANPELVAQVMLRIPTEDGNVMWTDWEFIAVKDESGHVHEVQGIGFDISDKVNNLNRLRESEKKLKAIFDSKSNDCYVLISPDYEVLFHNRAWDRHSLQLYGKQLETGGSFIEFLPEEMRVEYVESINAAFNGRNTRFEKELCLINGSRLWFEISFHPVYLDSELAGVAINSVDISKDKQYEQELLDKNEVLKDYAFLTSHKLRAPLSNILGLTQLLMSQERSQSEIMELVGYIQEQSLRLDKVIHDLNSLVSDSFFTEKNKEYKEIQKLVLIDDDPIVNMISRKLIGTVNPNLFVDSFTDPRKGLEYISSNKPDLLFLDIDMPLMNGWDFLEELSAKGVDVDVVILTSSNDPEDKRKASAYKQVKDFLTKPLTEDELKQRLVIQ